MKEINDYINNVDEKRRDAYIQLYNIIKDNIPDGFEAGMEYGIPSFHVPLDTYPQGYLNRVDEPLPFISIAAQKNHIAVYHMGVMAKKDLRLWFEEEYKQQVPTKLDMGKSCIRLKNINHIPYHLIGELVSKMEVEEWIEIYEKAKG